MRAGLRIALFLCVLGSARAAIVTDSLQDDAGSGGDAGDAWWMATAFSTPSSSTTADGTYSGTLYTGDDGSDWYEFLPNGSGASIWLNLTAFPTLTCPLAPPMRVTLFNSMRIPVDSAVVQGCTSPVANLTGTSGVYPGDWLIQVGFAGTGLPTGMRTNLDDPPPSPPASRYDFELGCRPVCLRG